MAEEFNNSQGFLKLIRSDLVEDLLENFPDAFLLLTLTAIRAKRTDSFSSKNLQSGECLLEGHKSCGLTRKKYRNALIKLQLGHFVAIRRANRGTIVKILDKRIYDINSEVEGHQKGHQRAIRGPSEPPTHIDKEERKNERKEIYKEKAPPVLKTSFREWVSLTDKENEKLLFAHGKEFADAMLDILDAYNTQKQKHYPSDYGAMKRGGWVYKEAIKRGHKSNEDSKGNVGKSGNPEAHKWTDTLVV